MSREIEGERLNVLDLFSGIGGFSLGLERAGMRTIAFCEIDRYCQRILRRHWSDVPVFGDVRELTAQVVANAISVRKLQSQGYQQVERRRSGDCSIDVICGGFPCQDISIAGKGAGITGSRSGLWSEYARLISEIRPRYAIVENVSALLHRGLADVLGDLAALGYDAEWHCIPASAVGAPHRRDRIWIVAYTDDWRGRSDTSRRNDANCSDAGRSEANGVLGTIRATGRAEGLAYAQSNGRHAWRTRNATQEQERRQPDRSGIKQDVAHADRTGRLEQWRPLPIRSQLATAQCADWWRTEPELGRVAHGIPNRVDRLRALGNAIVPQIAEIIGRAIMEQPR